MIKALKNVRILLSIIIPLLLTSCSSRTYVSHKYTVAPKIKLSQRQKDFTILDIKGDRTGYVRETLVDEITKNLNFNVIELKSNRDKEISINEMPKTIDIIVKGTIRSDNYREVYTTNKSNKIINIATLKLRLIDAKTRKVIFQSEATGRDFGIHHLANGQYAAKEIEKQLFKVSSEMATKEWLKNLKKYETSTIFYLENLDPEIFGNLSKTVKNIKEETAAPALQQFKKFEAKLNTIDAPNQARFMHNKSILLALTGDYKTAKTVNSKAIFLDNNELYSSTSERINYLLEEQKLLK